MALSRQDFEIAAGVLWRDHSTSADWQRTASAFHGICLVAEGRIKEEATLLYDIARIRRDMAADEEFDRRMTLLEVA